MNRERDAGQHPAGPTMPFRRPAPEPHQPHTASPSAYNEPLTQPIPAVAPVDPNEETQVIKPVDDRKPSLLKASGSMAIATLISRITGFLWKLMLASVIGTTMVNDSFTVANNLPNQVFEFLIGGVLTSVIVPVLIRAEKSDADGGEAYIQRLLSLSIVVLSVGTVLSVIGAQLLVSLYMPDNGQANPILATALAYLLLPQIFFYGLSALVSAILQSKQIFNPPAWAPVMNNLLVIATIGVFAALPGELHLNPVRMDDAHLLVLGIGVTLGVAIQAAVQIPALRNTGFRFRFRWGWDPRLSEFGGLTLWMLTYVAISQVGLMAMSRVGTQYAVWAKYNLVWMLLQLPYGVIGFSVMTAILPRMSAAAADGDHKRLIDDLSLGNRLSTVSLLPISALMTTLGVPVAIALFSGKAASDANVIGLALAVSAFGVLPYAITMMQMRVFYALKDARTPTLIMVVMVVVKIALSLLCLLMSDPQMVLYGLVLVNSLSFVIGWAVGEVWLRLRLGGLGSKRFLITLGKTLVASIIGAALAWLLAWWIGTAMPGPAGPITAWLQIFVGGFAGLGVIFVVMSVLRVAEVQPAIGRITAALRRR